MTTTSATTFLREDAERLRTAAHILTKRNFRGGKWQTYLGRSHQKSILDSSDPSIADESTHV